MVSDGSVSAIALLLFSTFTQGHFGVLDRSYSVSRSVGESVRLPCSMEEEHTHRVTQIEWKKMEGHQEHKIAIYNPSFPPLYYWTNVSLGLETPGGVLRGSFLKLAELDEWDSGVYICELTSFPAGTVKIKTRLSVTAVQVYAAVLWPIRAVREGDAVTVLCNSTPPARSYSLWPLQDKSSILKNKDGNFTLSNVRREDSDIYVCQPENSSFGQAFDGYSATVNITVNYLDEIECDANRITEVTAGQNITVTCAAKASQSSLYTWRKDNVTVATSGSLHLGPMASEQAGVYVFTAVVKDTGLWRQAVFDITVRADFGDLLSSVAPPISTTATNEESHDVILRSTAVSTATEGNTTSSISTLPPWTASSAAPERNVSNGPASAVNATQQPPFNGTENGRACTHRQPTTTSSHGARVTVTEHLSNSSRNVTDVSVTLTESQGSAVYVLVIILPVLFLLLVILFLYRRHMVQRKYTPGNCR